MRGVEEGWLILPIGAHKSAKKKVEQIQGCNLHQAEALLHVCWCFFLIYICNCLQPHQVCKMGEERSCCEETGDWSLLKRWGDCAFLIEEPPCVGWEAGTSDNMTGGKIRKEKTICGPFLNERGYFFPCPANESTAPSNVTPIGDDPPYLARQKWTHLHNISTPHLDL